MTDPSLVECPLCHYPTAVSHHPPRISCPNCAPLGFEGPEWDKPNLVDTLSWADRNPGISRPEWMTPEPEWWERHGYLAGRHLEGGVWVCLVKMIFTYRLMLCTPDYVLDHYCYEDLALATRAWEVWDGRSDPPDGWLRHHASGRRREAGDPKLETVGE